jgi:hypothetical protein
VTADKAKACYYKPMEKDTKDYGQTTNDKEKECIIEMEINSKAFGTMTC